MLAVEMDDVFWFESLTSFDLELTFSSPNGVQWFLATNSVCKEAEGESGHIVTTHPILRFLAARPGQTTFIHVGDNAKKLFGAARPRCVAVKPQL